MAGRTMGGTNTGRRKICKPVKMSGNDGIVIRDCRHYEEVRELVEEIDEAFIDGFDTLFPSPSAIDNYPFIRFTGDNDDLFDLYKDTYKLNHVGALICTVLHQYKENGPDTGPDTGTDSSSDREMSIVYFPSIEALITKDPSLSVEKLKTEQQSLSEGFDKAYIDPHGYVEKIADRLSEYMSKYIFTPGWVAPYTSLVTSSMMGKSRLMKELARRVPIVYMCVRGENDGGFPKATAGILKWFKDGAIGELGVDVTAPDIASDSDYIIATLRHSLFLLNLLKHLRDLIEDVFQTTPTRYPSLDGHIKVTKSSFEWMWYFFADYKQPYVTARGLFWENVKAQTHVDFVQLRNSGSSATSEWAKSHLTGMYEDHIGKAALLLRQTLAKWYKGLGRQRVNSLTVIICFDEASRLCTTSSVTGNRINTGDEESAADLELANGYSNFQAMRRALRYLSLHEDPVPRVFGLFTDTTSRLTNFQPRQGDERSLRVVDLPEPGKKQFDPIYVFTSIDAHAMAEDRYYAISDPTEVAKAETLLKFGRAGWYSCYSRDSPSFGMKPLLRLAMSKLIGGASNPVKVLRDEKQASKNRLRLLAVVACRLALTVGPFSAEARDLVSSHLAILLNTDTDTDRHFLNIYYPSEPILAEASAKITAAIGWLPAVQALYQQLQNGIVNAGYRGELLSKVLCLIAMDRIEKPFSSDENYWKHTQPVKTRDFLDGWLAPPAGYKTFTAALLEAPTHANKTELERFLDGHVFFTHFIRLDRILSVPAMVHAWNRGAAIMCQEYTHSFDHVIPVMLKPTTTLPPTFGAMYEQWNPNTNELKRACSNVSGIFINSKCYGAAVNQNNGGHACAPTKQNFEDFEMFGGKKVEEDGTAPTSVFLSIVQDFGPRRKTKEGYVNILPQEKGVGLRHDPARRQIVVVLKELGPNTYTCLQDSPSADDEPMDDVDEEDRPKLPDASPDTPMRDVGAEEGGDGDDDFLPEDGDEELEDGEMAEVTKFLRMLRTANLRYLDNVDKENFAGVKDYLPGVYVGEVGKAGDEVDKAHREWLSERRRGLTRSVQR